MQNRDNEPHGVKGFVLYEGLDFAILCAFDKPYVGTLKSLGTRAALRNSALCAWMRTPQKMDMY